MTAEELTNSNNLYDMSNHEELEIPVAGTDYSANDHGASTHVSGQITGLLGQGT